MLDNWQRIEQVLKWAGAASVSAFAREIGLHRGENLYQIKRGNNGISKDLAENITKKYPSVSKAWLLTGEGDMLPGKGSKKRYDIPFYKTDAVQLLLHLETGNAEDQASEFPEPDHYVSLPMLQECDLAAFSFSDSMQPEIPRGSIVFLKRTGQDEITPGGMYLVVTRNFSGIRYLRKNPKSNDIRLIPANKEDYDEMVIDMKDVDAIYRVKSFMVNNF